MIVVDASIAAKWTFGEEDSGRALAIAHRDDVLAAPSIIVAELCSVAWKRVRRGLWEPSDASASVSIAVGMLDAVVPVEALWERALTLSMATDHPVYDCFYLALAAREASPLASADGRMLDLARALGIAVETI